MATYYAPYYPRGPPPHSVPMYYQPQPMQFITVGPQSAVPDANLMGLSTAGMAGVPLSHIEFSRTGTSRSQHRQRASVDSRESRSTSNSRTRVRSKRLKARARESSS